MRSLRLLVAPLCLATLGLVAKPAHAQQGTLTVSNILWKNRPNKSLMSNTLNRDDCLANVKATVSAAVRNVSNSGLTFELWSGTGCDQQANRASTSVSRTCSKVKTLGTPVNQEIEIAFRDLIKPYGDDDPATEDVCEQNVANGLISRTLYYIIIDSSFNSAIATTPSWSFKYDIKGPPPPTSVSAEAGDSSLVTSFTPTPNEPNLLRYHFYCSEKGTSPVIANQEIGGASTGGTGGTGGSDTGGTGGSDTGGTGGSTGGTAGSADTGDAGSGDTGGTSGSAGSGVVIDPNCQSATLIPGEDVPADAWECGSVGAVGAKGGETNPDLTNGDEYVVAVAAEDNVNNLGKLSNLACGTPKDARGFFENYRKAGGQAGGGYCSFAPPRHTGTAALLGLGSLALVLRRRQK